MAENKNSPKCDSCKAPLNYTQSYGPRGLEWDCPNCGAVCNECYAPLELADIGKDLICPNCEKIFDGE